jgi:hypothetical protein
MKNEFASVKLSKKFASWLKIEAATWGMTMYSLVEKLAEKDGDRPWDTDRPQVTIIAFDRTDSAG